MYNRVLSLIVLIFIVAKTNAQQSVRIHLTSFPQTEAAGTDIYAAGSFNEWNPHNEKYRFTKNGNGSYFLDLHLADGSYEYKITRGDWSKVECRKSGTGIENRTITVPADSLIKISVEAWQDQFPAQQRPHTASKNVRIIDTAFWIPQLKRYRRVWIYLPEDYKAAAKRYPVLYMHDGQNIFDDATSYAGEWGVDEYLDSTKFRKCIVVGIDNGGDKRLNEYCPNDFDLKGIAANYKTNKGEGGLYIDFLVKTLKPFIDKKYRTLKTKSNTFIAGSSMGGLISLYAVLKYPAVFGGAGVFSPAFWVSGEKIFTEIKRRAPLVNSHIYFYGGKLESDSMIPDMLKALQGMANGSRSKMTTVIRDDGRHNEPTWRREFPLFYEWIMKQATNH